MDGTFYRIDYQIINISPVNIIFLKLKTISLGLSDYYPYIYENYLKGPTTMAKRSLILFYNTMYGESLNYSIDELPENVCITTDKTYLRQADFVVFHIPDLRTVIGKDELEKQKGQIWIAWSLECEVNYPMD